MTDEATLKQRFKILSSPLDPEETGEEPVLNKLAGIKAVIFDFYGTLFISGVGDIGIDEGKSDAGLLIESMKGANIQPVHDKVGKRGYEIYDKVVTEQMQDLKSSGIPYPEPDIRKVWRNVLNQMYAEDLIGESTSSDQHDRMAVEFEVRMNPIWPMPGLEETLSGLKEKNLELGIISNSQFYTPIAFEALAGKTLDQLGFNPHLLHWSYEESRKKPGLVFYEHFLKKASKHLPDLEPENYLYVGNDMLKDVYPAHEVGLQTALFAGDSRSLKWRPDDSRTKDLRPDLVITELNQILDCV
ncbi:HAD family hydrolase [Rhodohalobacter sp. 8-1]|uniref:HAD family hydrolase n=1 Tax=Rhodohalobacter sp. 8-1 TaxID=3131972 RepID=UPI0030EDC8C3